MSSCENLRFVCPACSRSIAVTEPMRDALVESGCVVCGTDVDDEAFGSERDA